MADENVIEQTRTVLKKHNLRITAQRHIILAYLASHPTHPTVEMIKIGLNRKLPNLGSATIYNTLNTLVEHGIVIELQNGDGSTHYDYFEHHHYHAICDNCGKITDIAFKDYPKLENELQKQAESLSGYAISSDEIAVHGLCPECQIKLNFHR